MSLVANYFSKLETDFANSSTGVEHSDIVAGGTHASQSFHILWDWLRKMTEGKKDVIIPLPQGLLPKKCFITGFEMEVVNDGQALIINLMKRRVGGGSEAWTLIPNYQTSHRVLGFNKHFNGIAFIPPVVGSPTRYGKTVSQEEAYELFNKLSCYPPSSVMDSDLISKKKSSAHYIISFSDVDELDAKLSHNAKLLRYYLEGVEARSLLARLVTGKIQNDEEIKQTEKGLSEAQYDEFRAFLEVRFQEEVHKHAKYFADNIQVSAEYLEVLTTDLKAQENEKAVQIDPEEEVGVCIETANMSAFGEGEEQGQGQGFQAFVTIHHLYAKIVDVDN